MSAPTFNVQPLRTAAEVTAAREAVVTALAAFPSGTVQELTFDLLRRLSECKTLADVHVVLPPTSKWQLALVDDGFFENDDHDYGCGDDDDDDDENVRDGIMEFFKGESPVLWAATASDVEPAVLEYFLEQPCMKFPWVLEAVSMGLCFERGVPPEMRPCIGRGCTPLSKCVAMGGLPSTIIQKCQLLLNAGACLTACDRHGQSILHCAVKSYNPEVVKWVIDTWVAAFPEPGSVDWPVDLDGVTPRDRDRIEHRGFAHLFPPLVV
jgi:hypothetical protein